MCYNSMNNTRSQSLLMKSNNLTISMVWCDFMVMLTSCTCLMTDKKRKRLTYYTSTKPPETKLSDTDSPVECVLWTMNWLGVIRLE